MKSFMHKSPEESGRLAASFYMAGDDKVASAGNAGNGNV
jgi:hypothetical protein